MGGYHRSKGLGGCRGWTKKGEGWGLEPLGPRLGLGGGSKGFGAGKIGGRGTGPGAEQISQLFEKKKHLWGGEGTRARGGSKGFGSGGVGGRGTAPGTAQISQLVSYLTFLTRTKRRKMTFFEGCLVGWGGYPPCHQGPSKEWGLGWLFQKVQKVRGP